MTGSLPDGTVVEEIGNALNSLLDLLPIAPPLDPAPVRGAVVAVVAEPTDLRSVAASLAAAVSSAPASEAASAATSPAAYPTARACQVTKGRPPSCTPGPTASPTPGTVPTVPSPLPALPSATPAVGSTVPTIPALQQPPSDNPVCTPSSAPSVVKNYVCKP